MPSNSNLLLKSCGVCGDNEGLIFLEKKLDNYGLAVDIYICRNCQIIVNGASVDDNAMQKHVSENVYKYTKSELLKIRPLIDDQKKLLEGVLPYFPNLKNNILVEFGSGRGLLLVAASELGFKKAIGIELNTSTFFNETKSQITMSDKIMMVEEWNELNDKADCLVLWHVLEHIKNPNLFFDSISNKLNIGCVLFLQVPQYHQPYIYKTHHYFYNEPSMRRLLTSHGFQVLNVMYDYQLQFLTVVAKFKT